MSDIEIQFGLENFANYKRLSYKWWYALAEFVDNSTQSYIDNRNALDAEFKASGDRLHVIIARDKDFIRITDNAMGMDLGALKRSMVVGVPPANPQGRSRYGLGMKTAACWIGNRWKIITTRLGDPNEYTLEIDVEKITSGEKSLPLTRRDVETNKHYTVLEIHDHHHPLRGRTVGKAKEHLSSIYRRDISEGLAVITFDDEDLTWKQFGDDEFLRRTDGSIYKTNIIFETPEKKIVDGWVGILKTGSRSRANAVHFRTGRFRA
jgi:hypothetical protein